MRLDGQNSTELVRIGELARHAGVSVRTLRYYEEVGLLQPNARAASRYRLYDRATLNRLLTIKRMKLLGFRLTEIRRLVETYQEAGRCDPVRDQFRDLLLTHIQRCDEGIAELVLLKENLQKRLDRINADAQGMPETQIERGCRVALGAEPLAEGGVPIARESDSPR